MAFLTEQYYYLFTMPSKVAYPVLIAHGEAEPAKKQLHCKTQHHAGSTLLSSLIAAPN
jgi:hypothetical protein